MAATGCGVDVRKRRRIAKERAFVPLLGSDYRAKLNTAFEEQPDDVNEHDFDFGKEYICTSRTVVLFELIS